MSITSLNKDNQIAIVENLMKYVYPLYCLTGVDNYDYFFIGTCFPLRISNRLFFVFTEHQYKLADGKTILVVLPDRKNSFLAIYNEGITRFFEHDLAVFEVTQNLEDDLITLCETMLKPIQNLDGFEYFISGCHQVLNSIDYESKEIAVKKASLITNIAAIEKKSPEFHFKESCLIFAPNGELTDKNTFNSLTQGLSGSPILAYRIISMTEDNNWKIDLRLVGVSTHVSESKEIVYSTHPMHLLSCLNARYGIFDEYE